MTDVVTLGIRLTIDGKEVAGEIRGQAAAIQQLGQAAATSSKQAKTEADNYVASLKRQADTLGMTKSQTMAYEASQHQLTAAQRESVAQSMRAIDAHERHQQILGRVRTAAAVAGAALATAFVAGAAASIRAAGEAEQANLKLEAVLRATGHAAGLSKAQLDAQAEAMQRRTGFDDETVRNSMAVMLSFRQVQGETFGAAMTMAADLSKLLGQDLQSSVLMLGKALEDPETGLLALRRAGVSFNESQKETIKHLADTGRQAEALTLILQTMREQGVDKVAESMHRGLVGAMTDVKNEWGDLLEAFGRIGASPIVPVLGHVARMLNEIRYVVELPTMQRIGHIFSLGTYRPEVGEASLGDQNARELARTSHGAVAARERAGARDQWQQLGKGFRTDAEKMNEELAKARELARRAEVSADELAKVEANIRAKFQKGGDRKRPFDYVGAVFGQGLEQDLAKTFDRLRREEMERARSSAAAIDAQDKQAAAQQEVLTGLHLAYETQIGDIKEEARLLGLSEREREKLIETLKVEKAERAALAKLDEDSPTYARDVARIGAESAAARSRVGAAVEERAIVKEATELRKREQEEWKRMVDDVGRSLTDRIIQGGIDSAQAVRDLFVDAFKSMVLRPIIQPIVTGAVGTLAGALGFPGAAGASSGGGFGLSNLSSLGNLFTGNNPLSFLGLGGAAAGGMGFLGPLGLGIGALALGSSLFGGSGKTPAVGAGVSVTGTVGRSGWTDASWLGHATAGDRATSWSTYAHGPNLNPLITDAFRQVEGYGRMLGLDTSVLNNTRVPFSFRTGQSAPQGPTGADVMKAFEENIGKVTETLARKLLPNFDALARAGESAAQTLERLAQEARQAALNRMGAAIGLEDSTRDLWLTDLSPLTARERLDRASSMLGEYAAGARGGDIASFGKYSSGLRGYLQEASRFYGTSTADYRGIFDARQAESADIVGTTLNENAISLASMGGSLEQIVGNTAALKDLDKRIAGAIERAIGARLDTQIVVQRASTQQIVQAVSSGGAGPAWIDDAPPPFTGRRANAD